MVLSAGTRLGRYEITRSSPPSARAAWARSIGRDTRLNREIALKIPPQAVATDPDRLARFQREAERLAASTTATSHTFTVKHAHAAMMTDRIANATRRSESHRRRLGVMLRDRRAARAPWGRPPIG
jgi:hypothetical protein